MNPVTDLTRADARLPLESRRTRLRPPTAQFIEHVYLLAATGEIPWLWRGAPETPQGFHELVWRDVLVQFAIEDRRSGQPVGLVSAHSASLFHGYAYTSFTLLPQFRKRVWPFEGTVLFGNYLFTRFGLRNLYAETTGSLYEEFRSGAGRLFNEIGRFQDRLMVNGEADDLVVLGMTAKQWADEGAPLLHLATRPSTPAAPPIGTR